MGLTTAAAMAAICCAVCSPAHAAPDLLVADFEGPTYGDWKAEGEAFGPGPAQGTLPNQMAVSGYLGHGLVNSFYHGDDTTGRLTSPPLKIERPYLNFLIGGGMHPGEACIDLLIDGQVVRTATGPNDKPGGSERLGWWTWDVAEFAGRTAVIRIVDRRTGGWGHINIDQIVQSDERWQEVEQSMELTLEKQYLNFPVKNGAPMRRLSVRLGEGGQAFLPVLREFDIELALDEPDFWVFMDVSAFRGQQATVTTKLSEKEASVLQRVTNDDRIRGAEDLYRERYRPQFHFSSRRGWNNDPNGLVYYAGEYHLFYQHNPYGWKWGNMHWGHAVSPDLVHWTELADALHPDQHGTCFSGSAVVDEQNTAGFQTGDEKPIVCIYTGAGDPFTQCIAYSNDRGRTWTQWEGNPVLQHIIGGNRDPKVIWHEPERKWVMALFLDGNDYALFSSPDLKQWERMSGVNLPGTSECPEFFEIALDGKPDDTRWVFYGGNGQYLIGGFDGKTFTQESGPHRLNFGNCFYASQTFNNTPDGRRILIGWGTFEMPGMAFNQMMDFPVELSLRSTAEGPRLFVLPAREIESLHAKKHTWSDLTLKEGENPLAGITGDLFHLRAEFEVGAAAQFGFHVRGIPVVFATLHNTLSCFTASAPLEPQNGKIKLELLVDRTSIEVYANDGLLYMPVGVIPSDQLHSLDVFTRGADTKLTSLEVYELKSAWR
jgi:fructan beta-fructosidase